MGSALEQTETLRQLVGGVYAAGVRPLARSIRAMWSSIPTSPLRILLAVPGTVAALMAMAVYAMAATVVPLCVAFILTLTSPIILYVAVTGPFGSRAPRRSRRT